MDNWTAMFREARSVVHSAIPWTEGLKQAVAFARANPNLFGEPDYWTRAESRNWRDVFAAITGWATEGWDRIASSGYWSQAWEFVMLDLGDCPEIFKLYIPGGQNLMSEEKLREFLLRDGPLGCSELPGCFGSGIADPFNLLFGDDRATWTYHNVRELKDKVLSWNRKPGALDYHGNSGYFLWLMLGSLAMVHPLRNPDYCKKIVRDRARIYLLSGFEEIFTYLATVTPNGLQYEPPSSKATEPNATPSRPRD